MGNGTGLLWAYLSSALEGWRGLADNHRLESSLLSIYVFPSQFPAGNHRFFASFFSFLVFQVFFYVLSCYVAIISLGQNTNKRSAFRVTYFSFAYFTSLL